MANRYNHRITADIVPMDTAEDVDDDTTPLVPNLKRNLIGDFGRPSVLEPPIPHEHMKVYLRIRPFSKEEFERKEDQQCLSVETDRTVVTNAPKDSHFFKNMSRGSCRTTTRFTFSQIFKESTTQKDFFGSTMLGLVKDFIEGQNCLVFSYGVTSSGKTYTIQGNPKDAGILPRALDVLFNSINRRQWDGMDLKPKMFVDVTRLTPEQEMMERKVKERVMKLSCDDDMDVMSLLGDDASDISTATNITTCSESSNISTMDGKDSFDGNDHTGIFEELETRVREESKVSVDNQGQVKFSVWVSFAEIYNEQIYDLLEPVPPKKKNYRRPCLKLSDDKNGSPYIKGLKYIQVNSADEAYKLLTIGQRNLQTACTKLNHSSSRSHCIFNIKIIRVMDKDNPHAARISMLTLCDLAGSERYGKTQTSGDRLKEAGNINTSLLTLGRCIETLRHNQAHKEHRRIVPFRESKLTRLFQNFFVGQGKAAMVVNVNQLASMFDETMHVFKFSAIASKVEVQQKPVFIKPKLPLAPAPAQIPRTSISWATPAKATKSHQREAENVPLPEDSDLEEELEEEDQETYTQENIDELLGIIEQLQTDLENEIHSRYKHEKLVRKEVCEEMMKQFTEIEEQYSERIRVREQRAEELAEKRLQIVLDAERAKRKDLMNDGGDEWVSSVLLHQEKVKVEQRDETIKELKDEVAALKAGQEKENQSDLEDLRNEAVEHETKIKELEDQLNKERERSVQVDGLMEKISEYEQKIKSFELTKKTEPSVEESSKADLVENLTQQLQQTRQHIKDQEKEISELNDMLTEAGETFELKEEEISKLKELAQDNEKRMETQAEAINVLERAAADGKVAMETADQSLSQREECVTSLQAQIRDLEGDVNKYRNKARFFEEQIVEKEHDANHWKQKYEKDLNDHASSQEALIHGFNAEISNLKSQIFHFKSQLYGVKSPTKSPGGTLRSPDVKMRLFPMSPLNSSGRDKDLNTSGSHQSPTKDREVLKNNVNEQVKALQLEMDKNCKMITELEHALQISRGTVEDFEKRFASEYEKCKTAEKRIEELEIELKNKNNGLELRDNDNSELKNNDVDESKKIESNNHSQVLAEKDKEIEELNKKIKELEPLMTDYFSTSKKLTDSDKKIRELAEVIVERDNGIIELEEKIKELVDNMSDLKNQIHEKELATDKAEVKCEEIQTLNNELKGMLDKTATDLQTKEQELLILSPKSDKALKGSENDESVDSLKAEVTEKLKEIEDLKMKLSNMKTAYKMKDALLKEAIEKGNELEFKGNEIDIENEELKKQAKEHKMKIEDFQYELEKNLKEVQTTGEELALKSVEAEKSRRMVDELKASISDLESAVADKEVELCEKDKIIEDKVKQISRLTEENGDTDKENGVMEQEKDQTNEENERLKGEMQNLKTDYDQVLKEKDAKCCEIKEITEKMSNLTSESEQLKGQMHELEQEVSSLREELDEKESILEEVNDKMNEIRTQALEFQDKDKHLDDKVAVMEKRVFDLLEKSNEKDSEIQEKGETISKLQLQLSEKENENTALRESIEELKEKNEEENNSRLSEAMLEIAELKSSVHTQKALHHKVKGELEEALLTIENSRSELEGLRKQLTSVKENECNLKHKVEELENEMKTGLVEKEENSLRRVNEIETELKQRSDEIECAEKCVCEMKELLKRRDEQLEELHNELRNVNKNNEKVSKEFETELKQKSDEIECAEKIVCEMKELLKRRDEQLVELHNELRNANKNNEKVGNEIVTRNEQIAQLEKDIVEKESKINTVQIKLQETEEQLSSKTNEMKFKEESYTADSNNIKTLTYQITALKEEKDMIQENFNSKNEIMRAETRKLRQELGESYKTNEERETSLKDLNARFENMEKENKEMRNELLETKKHKDAENELKSQLSLKEVECETLNLELKVLKDDLTKETEKYETVKEQLEGIKKLSGDVTETNGVTCDSNKCCDHEQLEKHEEIQRLYESEKKKNEEYKLLISDTGEMSCLSPMSGARKMRKEKIELENTLIEANFKISSLESKAKDLEIKLKNARNEQATVPSHDPLLQRKLNSVTAKLQETENTNKSLIKEITQLQSLAERLEQDLKEEQDRKDVAIEKDIHRRSRASILQADIRQSISSPSTKMELAKTREREHCLKEQLTDANSKIQEWLGKLSDTENKLQQKTQELKHARETVQQLEARNNQEGRNTDRQIEEYMEQNNNLKLQILKKEGELECCQRTLQDLQRQLDSEVGLMKTFEQDKKSQEEMISLLKETLKEQEDMLQEQEEYLNSKEAELQTCQTEHRELLDRYQALLESKDSKGNTSTRLEAERDLLKQHLTEMEGKFEHSCAEKDKIIQELKEKGSVFMETEKKLQKAIDEKAKLQSVIKENNQELKAMESSLTDARKEVEELKSHGADKFSEMHLEEMKRDAEKCAHDLNAKIRSLQCHNKEVAFKLSATEEKVKSLIEEKHDMEHKLKEFREERDKLVSGLEAVLKKKDAEIKQYKDMIKQLKEKEIQITKNWQIEREQIAAGLQDLNHQEFKVKSEPPDTPHTPPREENIYHRADTPLTRTSPMRQNSRGRPSRPSPPKLQSLEEDPGQEPTEIQTLSSSPGSRRHGSHAEKENTVSESLPANQNSGRAKRGSSRKAKKRPSSEGLENLPPLPKRRVKEDFTETESDDYSTHLQVDATPTVAAKTLRRTRKKNGSQVDLSKPDESDSAPRRSSRNKRSTKHRLLESFRESPMGRTSKRILDSIAETFSPKSPTRSPTKSPLREDNSGDNVSCDTQEKEKKPVGRGRGRHRLYKEETYISEPFESTGEFLQSPEDIHKSVTRSLRSRRH